MNKLQAALAWAARGFRVFPCGENSRSPISGFGQWWLHASADPGVIRSWWSDPISGIAQDYNIGVDTTGLGVVDIDTKHGEHALANYYAIGGHFDTLTVRSQSGGYHAYCKPDRPVANSQGSLAKDVDIRGHHGLVLAPGSTIDGKPYTVLRDLPIAPLPQPIFALCKPPRDRAQTQAVAAEADSAAAVAVAAAYLETVTPAVEGQGGNNATFQVAARARDLGVSEAVCFELMLEHFNERCLPPWRADDLRAIVEHAYEYAENPLGVISPDALLSGVQAVPPPPPIAADAIPEHTAERPTLAFGNALCLADLQPRPWIFRHFLERHEITLPVAPGGMGKSLLVLDAAIALATHTDLYGLPNVTGGPLASVIYNAEDSLNEMSMRLHAACIQRGVQISDVIPYIMLISGKTHGALRLVVLDGGQAVVNNSARELLLKLVGQPGVGMLALDPLVRSHSVNENDNVQMTAVMEAIADVGMQGDVGVLAPHHMAKPPQASYGPFLGSYGAGRGAVGITDAARTQITMGPPTSEDRTRYGLPDHVVNRLVRLDDAKLNRGIMRGEPLWLYKHTVHLTNGEDVGAFDKANIQDLATDQRDRIARTLYVELTARARASLTITEAASLVMRLDPLYAKISPAQVRNKIELMLTEPVYLDGAGCVMLKVEGNTKRIVYE